MARPPWQGGTPTSSSTGRLLPSVPDATPDPPAPCDPPEFVRICMPPGEQDDAWDLADWILSLSIDWSGVDFSGCADPTGCETAVASSYWNLLQTADGFNVQSAEGSNGCTISTPGIDIGAAFDWEPQIAITRFNGPAVNNIQISLVTNNVAPPGELFVTFLLSDDRFSSSDYPGWDNFGSPPFNAFPFTWTQEVRCQNNNCPSGTAVMTLELVPNCPDGPNDNPTGLPESDPCKTGASLSLDCFDPPSPCNVPPLPDGTCPDPPDPPDAGCWIPGQRFVVSQWLDCPGPTRGAVMTHFSAVPQLGGQPRISTPFVKEADGSTNNLFMLHEGGVHGGTFEREEQVSRYPQKILPGVPDPFEPIAFWQSRLAQDWDALSSNPTHSILRPAGTIRSGGNQYSSISFDVWDDKLFYARIGAALISDSGALTTCNPSFNYYSGPLCRDCTGPGGPDQLCPYWEGTLGVWMFISVSGTVDIWDWLWRNDGAPLTKSQAAVQQNVCKAGGFWPGWPNSVYLEADATTSVTRTGDLADVMLLFSFPNQARFANFQGNTGDCNDIIQPPFLWAPGEPARAAMIWRFDDAYDWSTQTFVDGSGELFAGQLFRESDADLVASTGMMNLMQPEKSTVDGSWTELAPGLTWQSNNIEIELSGTSVDPCRWQTANSVNMEPAARNTGGSNQYIRVTT